MPQHNLVFYLTECGRIPEARRVYGETRGLYRDFAEPWVQNRRKWVRARITALSDVLRRAQHQPNLCFEAPDEALPRSNASETR